MMKRTLGGVEVQIDEDANRAWYEQRPIWDCECGECGSFVANAKNRNLPAPVMEVLDGLGIPLEKVIYMCTLCEVREKYSHIVVYRVLGVLPQEDMERSVLQDWGSVRLGDWSYSLGKMGFPEPYFDLEFGLSLPVVEVDSPCQPTD